VGFLEEARGVTRPLVLLGAGGLAREVMATVDAINRESPSWHVTAVLDDREEFHGKQVNGVTVLAGTEAAREMDDAFFVACVASPRNVQVRECLVDRLHLDEDRFATIVHPSATVIWERGPSPGCVVMAQVVTTTAVSIGKHVVMMPHVVLTHDDSVDDFSTFGAGVCLAGDVRVGRSSYLGAGALVREGLVVGDRALVGMGSVVLCDVPPGQVWSGVPARRQPSRE
jgi:sugar O-acyltransferase (sialic acid O-acetyltransferase NeuD family)